MQKLAKFLRLPKSHRRAQSEPRDEIGPTGAQGGVGPATPRPTESTPDLRVGDSILPVPSPLAFHDQESNGMQVPSPWKIHLTALFYNTDEPLVSDQPSPVLNTGQNIRVEPSNTAVQQNAVDESESKLLSLASSGAKLFLRGVRESADAFGPLKAVAGGLCFILENCEVWTPCIVDYL